MTLQQEYQYYLRDCWLSGDMPETMEDWLKEPNLVCTNFERTKRQGNKNERDRRSTQSEEGILERVKEFPQSPKACKRVTRSIGKALCEGQRQLRKV